MPTTKTSNMIIAKLEHFEIEFTKASVGFTWIIKENCGRCVQVSHAVSKYADPLSTIPQFRTYIINSPPNAFVRFISIFRSIFRLSIHFVGFQLIFLFSFTSEFCVFIRRVFYFDSVNHLTDFHVQLFCYVTITTPPMNSTAAVQMTATTVCVRRSYYFHTFTRRFSFLRLDMLTSTSVLIGLCPSIKCIYFFDTAIQAKTISVCKFLCITEPLAHGLDCQEHAFTLRAIIIKIYNTKIANALEENFVSSFAH